MSASVGPRTLQELEANIMRIGQLQGQRADLIKKRDQLVVRKDQHIALAATHGAKAAEYHKSADAHFKSADAHFKSADAHGARAEVLKSEAQTLKAEAAVHKANAAKIAEFRAILLASKGSGLPQKAIQAREIPTSVVNAHSVASQSLVSAH